MKTIIRLFIIMALALCTRAVYAQDFTLTTYLPSPVFNVKKGIFEPHAKVDPCLPGTLFVNENYELSLCDSSGDETFANRAWSFDPITKDVYKTIDNQGNVGIGTTTPQFRLHLDQDGGILATGTYGSGTTLPVPSILTPRPTLAWSPRHSTLIAGDVLMLDTDLGEYSAAFGRPGTTLSQGNYAISSGESSTGGNYAAAFGFSDAGGDYSIASADGNASGDYSAAIGGSGNNVPGTYSGAFAGRDNRVNGEHSFAIGGFDNNITGDYSGVIGGLGFNLFSNYQIAMGFPEPPFPVTLENVPQVYIANDVRIQGLPAAIGGGTRESLEVVGSMAIFYGSTTPKDYAVIGKENLKMLSGSVDATGAVVAGQGFTVTKLPGAGVYQITYDQVFAGQDAFVQPPVPVVTPVSTTALILPTVSAMSTTGFTVTLMRMMPPAPIAGIDSQFNFTVSGERYAVAP